MTSVTSVTPFSPLSVMGVFAHPDSAPDGRPGTAMPDEECGALRASAALRATAVHQAREQLGIPRASPQPFTELAEPTAS